MVQEMPQLQHLTSPTAACLLAIATLTVLLSNESNVQRKPDHFWKTNSSISPKRPAQTEISARNVRRYIHLGDENDTSTGRQNLSCHPYMAAIFRDIEENSHPQLPMMPSEGPMIRGIESVRVQHGLSSWAILEFPRNTLKTIRTNQYTELVLIDRTAGPDKLQKDQFKVHIETSGGTKTWRTVPTHQRTHVVHNQTYVVLELGHCCGRFRPRRAFRLKLSWQWCSNLDHLLERPLLVVYHNVTPNNRMLNQRYRRRAPLTKVNIRKPSRHQTLIARSSLKQETKRKHHSKSNTEQQMCSLHKWYATLQDLNWDEWVVGPSQFILNYCSGSCEGPLAVTLNITNNAILRNTMSHSPQTAQCVPILLKSTNVIYRDKNIYVIEKIVTSQPSNVDADEVVHPLPTTANNHSILVNS